MKKYHIIIEALLLIIIVFIFLYGVFEYNNYVKLTNIRIDNTNKNNSTKNYVSKSMKLSVKVPPKFIVDTQNTTIILRDNEGEIVLGKTGTNFSSINDFLQDLISRGQYDIQERKDELINGNNAVSFMSGGNKYYYIYVDSWIYSFFTSSPTLYTDLDTTAQSFRYMP